MRRARSLRAIAGIAVAALALAACGSDEAATTPTSTAGSSAAVSTAAETTAAETTAMETSGDASSMETTPAETSSMVESSSSTPGAALKVGLAYDTGGRGDGTFNDAAGRGADKAKTDLGVEVKELEASSDDDRVPNIELLSSEKNDPIIAVGFLFSDTIAAAAAANPDLTYAIVDSVVDAPNVKSLIFAAEQGSFLVGAAAALKSKDGKIGFIGGQEGDLIKSFEVGFTAGAKQVNPDISVEVKYLGPAGDNTAWNSPDKAKEIAKAWYADGRDIIYSAAGGSGAGTIEAAVEAGEGNWAIGVDSDQYLLATPDQQKVILTSMLKKVDEAVYQTIEAVQKGDKAGGVKVFDLSTDGVGYSTSGGYVDDIAPQLEELKAQIIAGTITVPSS